MLDTDRSGWVMLTITFGLLLGGVALILVAFIAGSPWIGLLGLGLVLTGIVLFSGSPHQST